MSILNKAAALGLAATASTLLGLPAMAATEVDANGDGVMTLDEVQAVWAEVTPEQFAEADTDADGALSDEEMIAAQEKGVLPVEG